MFGTTKIEDLVVRHMHTISALTDVHKECLKKPDALEGVSEFIAGIGRVRITNYYFLRCSLPLTDQTFLFLFFAFCYNRARMRRKLNQLIPEWGALEAKAEEIENKVQTFKENPEDTFIFSCYVIDITAYTMNLFLKLGFELELYHHTELLSVLWWIELVNNYQLQNLKRFTLVPQKKGLCNHIHLYQWC